MRRTMRAAVPHSDRILGESFVKGTAAIMGWMWDWSTRDRMFSAMFLLSGSVIRAAGKRSRGIGSGNTGNIDSRISCTDRGQLTNSRASESISRFGRTVCSSSDLHRNLTLSLGYRQ